MSDDSDPEGVPAEVLDRIKKRVLEEEEAVLHYRRPPRIRPELKEVVEEEVTEKHLE